MNKFGLKREDFISSKEFRNAYVNLWKKSQRRALGIKDKNINKFELKKEDFETYKDFRKEYNRLSELEPKRKKYKAEFQQTLEYKDRIRPRKRKWAQDNRKRLNAIQNKRRASQLQRTPIWSETKLIEDFYIECPKGLCVDHILPLQGYKVSGLHTINNLQYLTRQENSSKGNRLPMNINLTRRTA